VIIILIQPTRLCVSKNAASSHQTKVAVKMRRHEEETQRDNKAQRDVTRLW
jgi:hypothetical protein